MSHAGIVFAVCAVWRLRRSRATGEALVDTVRFRRTVNAYRQELWSR